ncbi:MAG: hypothetical protein Q7V88_01255 [Actinomycetota bacterium]|nr:hypothetical protein [Actinomycetota bacterium]
MQFGANNDADDAVTGLTNASTGATLTLDNTSDGPGLKVYGGGADWAITATNRGLVGAGIAAEAPKYGMLAIVEGLDSTGYALRARSQGVAPGVLASSEFGVGLRAHSGKQAPLIIEPLQGDTPPSGLAEAGTLYMDHFGRLMVCVVGGNPGAWRILAAPASAGTWFPITPARVHDTRGGNKLSNGQSKVVFVGDSITPAGTVDVSGLVPIGAIAVSFNLTVVQTVGAGNLAVVPGDVTSTNTSTVNWTSGGHTVANASLCKLDSERQARVICKGSATGAAHFALDITGYYM